MKYIFFTILIFITYIDMVDSQENALVKEDFVGDWQGKINGENIEIAIWFTKRGMDSALGGYVILADSNCIQQFSYSEPSDHLWQYAKESNSTNALTRKEYFHSYQLSTRFPSWLDKHKNCSNSELIKNMSGIFSSYIFIKEFGESVQLAYTLLTDRENDKEIKRQQEIKLKQEKNKKVNKASRMKAVIDKRMRNRDIGIVRRAIKSETSAVKIKELELKLKKLEKEKSQISVKNKTPKFIYKTQVFKTILKRNVLSTLMLSLANEKRHYGSHPKPSKEEMAILQSIDG